MTARIGINQLRTLIMLGSPTMRLLTPQKHDAALIRRGLCERDGGSVKITVAGLRLLADEMEAGRVSAALEAMGADAKKAREQARAR